MRVGLTIIISCSVAALLISDKYNFIYIIGFGLIFEFIDLLFVWVEWYTKRSKND